MNIEGNPSGVAVTPDGNKLYVASRDITFLHDSREISFVDEMPPDYIEYNLMRYNVIFRIGTIIFVIGVVALIIVIGTSFVSKRK
ncbi:hypothetical protein SAMN02910340_00679 [Methanosarcina thermophila]|jgi:DNA-binding beta-propeller fold protein YncE|uniref:Surface layer protein n=2 Tax=Methanosarcina thermophila TaxID=2210 RepID=A0A0E3NE38_METTT|nr:hypothetical protein [Methanosarcina thermophila]ALK05785.1 MAG: hypothetical protein AAY43_08870 [Methanosarcina sp. 795]AKB12740.1 hypothetical protein MSTHT_0982 [Methanosarcina thermophila TM-1]SFT43496.1 hypothetical protein SAMN02910340_00679 [Methanosarcina thermophila]BAW30477.1 putative surface layer protein [Methanosarcina thermophila]GLI13358.1 hypothetical protein MTHERMMSTA1_04840 [Methanosarcina thermophila MST-A1]